MENVDRNNSLDELQSLWKSQTEPKSYDSEDIFKMIHKKSINSIQWLFIITLIEMAVGIILSAWSFVYGNIFFSEKAVETAGPELISKVENLSYLGLIGSLIFVGLTYYFYKKVSSALSVNQLMSTIMKFRKYIMWLIFVWVLFTLTIFTPVMMDIGKTIYLADIGSAGEITEEIRKKATMVGYLVAGLNLLLILIFLSLYYGIIYGIFLRRLRRNQRELVEIKE